mgnify:CR=1 FL=1
MKRIVTLLLAAGLVLGAAAGSQAADIKAKGNWTFSWQLGDNNLFEKNGEEQLPMASTTKIATALTVLDELTENGDESRLDETFSVSGTELSATKQH